MANDHDYPKWKVQYGARHNTSKPAPGSNAKSMSASKSTQATGAGVPAPGTYAPGTGPTVRPEWTGK